MEKKEKTKLKKLKITTISLMVLDVLVAIVSPFVFKYGNLDFAKALLMFLFEVLVPVTVVFMVVAFVYNFKSAEEEKRTAKQELVIKQRFWGRMILLAVSVVILIIYTSFRNRDIFSIVLMFILFALSILMGPLFGKIIKK